MNEIRSEIRRIVSELTMGYIQGSTRIKCTNINPESLINLMEFYVYNDLEDEKKVLSSSIDYLFEFLQKNLPEDTIQTLIMSLFHLIVSTNNEDIIKPLVVRMNGLVNAVGTLNEEIISYIFSNESQSKSATQAYLLLGLQYFIKSKYFEVNKVQSITLIIHLLNNPTVQSFDSLIHLIHSIKPTTEDVPQELIDSMWKRVLNCKDEKYLTLIFLELAELSDIGINLQSEHINFAIENLEIQIESKSIEKEKLISLTHMLPFLPINIEHFIQLILRISDFDLQYAIKLMMLIRESDVNLLSDESQNALLSEIDKYMESKDPKLIICSLIAFAPLITAMKGVYSTAFLILESILIEEENELTEAAIYAYESIIMNSKGLFENILKAFIPHVIRNPIAKNVFDFLVSKRQSQSILIVKTLAEQRPIFREKTELLSDLILKSAGFPSNVTEETASFLYEYAKELITHDDPDDLTVSILIFFELEHFMDVSTEFVDCFSKSELLVEKSKIYGLFKLLNFDFSFSDISLPCAQNKDELEKVLFEMCINSLRENITEEMAMMVDSLIGSTPIDQIEEVYQTLEELLQKCTNRPKEYICHSLKQLAKTDKISFDRVSNLIKYDYQFATVCVKKDLSASGQIVKNIFDSLQRIDQQTIPDALCPIVSYTLRNLEDKDVVHDVTLKLYDMICVPCFDVSMAILSSLGTLLRANKTDAILDHTVFYQIRLLWEESLYNENIESISSVALLALEIAASFSEGNSYISRLLCDVLELLPLPPDFFDMEAAIECLSSLVQYEWVRDCSELCIKIVQVVGLIITQKSQIWKYDLTGDSVSQARDCFKTLVSLNYEYFTVAAEMLSNKGIHLSAFRALLK